MDRQSYMIGSYAPRVEPYEYVTPFSSWPSGMLARGHYVATLKVRVSKSKWTLNLASQTLPV